MPDTPDAARPDADAAPDQTKDRFRAALERKRSQQHAANADTHGDSKVHGAHARAGGRREFRRKSG